ncbi:MAG: hypothetical protein AAF938_20525 [Myxococcota bacterium]
MTRPSEAQGPPCPICGRPMRFTGLPDFSGPVYERIYECREHGFHRVPTAEEPLDGWG